jgi:plasmid maintenance system antidote protein VapI
MSLRLSKYFGMSEKFWINLQTDIDIREKKDKLKSKLDTIKSLKLSA